jgi:glycosyltransferase involved in cell wall biosynthesis
MPAHNAAATLEKTVLEIPKGSVDEVILVDDGSQDDTAEIARRLGLTVILPEENRGYGANQKTCYSEAQTRCGHRDHDPSRPP